MESERKEKIFVPSDYFFWFLVGVIACFAIFSFFTLKTWQVFAFVFVLGIVFAVSRKPLAVSFLCGFLFGFLRVLFWSGDIFSIGFSQDFLNFLGFIRNEFSLALTRLFPEPVAGFSQGIILGGKDIKFSKEFWQALKITSTAHLIAVSGYNITLISRYISRFLVWITLHRKLIWIFAGFGVIVFVIFVGAPASAVRAGVLSILMLIAQRFGREGNPKIALTFALALMSFFDPLALKNDLGLQLSFLASFGIFYVAPSLTCWASPTRRHDLDTEQKQNSFAQTVFETLSAQIMVLPLILYKFGTLSLVGILANFILVPWIWLAMGFSFFSGLAMIVFEPLGRVIGFFSYPFLNFFVKVIEFFAGLPMAGLSGIYISPLLLTVCYLGIFWFIYRIHKIKNRDSF